MNKLAIMLAATTALVGCTAVQLNRAEVQGQLYCAKATAAGPLVVAIATVTGGPLSVIGLGSEVVAAACAAIDAIPVSPPANPAAAPTVTIAK